MAQIKAEHKAVYLGVYEEPEAAAEAYDQALILLKVPMSSSPSPYVLALLTLTILLKVPIPSRPTPYVLALQTLNHRR